MHRSTTEALTSPKQYAPSTFPKLGPFNFSKVGAYNIYNFTLEIFAYLNLCKLKNLTVFVFVHQFTEAYTECGVHVCMFVED